MHSLHAPAVHALVACTGCAWPVTHARYQPREVEPSAGPLASL